ncbi:hypothetical protein CH380_09590 [Leptospira adleri]|uniref:Uncharacterized protein n=1 Tax=Leptospira adleri TaxID=2023186 RepID=A0A2M9YPH3_9LEPT|nr:hypothetical protein CH380_09590 [Leptospira adleri]PJZ63020.1 hypothetical protein CH376_04950 [Leptospira adleri]
MTGKVATSSSPIFSLFSFFKKNSELSVVDLRKSFLRIRFRLGSACIFHPNDLRNHLFSCSSFVTIDKEARKNIDSTKKSLTESTNLL